MAASTASSIRAGEHSETPWRAVGAVTGWLTNTARGLADLEGARGSDPTPTPCLARVQLDAIGLDELPVRRTRTEIFGGLTTPSVGESRPSSGQSGSDGCRATRGAIALPRSPPTGRLMLRRSGTRSID